jgi:hypothetical protein
VHKALEPISKRRETPTKEKEERQRQRIFDKEYLSVLII